MTWQARQSKMAQESIFFAMLTVLGIMQRHDEAMAAFACLGRKGGARRMRRGSNYCRPLWRRSHLASHLHEAPKAAQQTVCCRWREACAQRLGKAIHGEEHWRVTSCGKVSQPAGQLRDAAIGPSDEILCKINVWA